MSKKCMIRREAERTLQRTKFKAVRETLRAVMKDPGASLEEKFAAIKSFGKLPRDSAAVRSRRRCPFTGRPRGVYRTVGMCRNMFRIHAMQGDIPGIHKASW